MTPVGAARNARSRASARSRAAGTIAGTPSGTGASSSTRRKRSSTTRPALTSSIDALLERLDAHAADGIDEQLVWPFAQLEVGGSYILDHVGDVAIRHRRPQELAELGVLAGAATDRHLVILLAVLLDPENADMADVMMAAGVDAAGDVDVQPAEAAGEIEILEAPRDLFRHRDRARIGEAAIVEAGTGDDVGDQADVGGGDADRIERPPQRRQITLGNVWQHQVLLVPDADLAVAVTVGQIGDGVHLLRGGVA